jgi:DNA-binding MarR family transcriptional regulator
VSDDRTDFIRTLGPAFLAHLLRRISDELVEADRLWHLEQGIANAPRTSSTLLALDQKGPLSVTELAAILRQSHQLAQQWVADLRARGLIKAATDPGDARRSVISLTAKGRKEVDKLKRAIEPIEQATREMLEEISEGLYDSLWDIESALRARPFIDRVQVCAERQA